MENLPQRPEGSMRFSALFSELGQHWTDITYRLCILSTCLSVPACSTAVWRKLDVVLISAHLLHVGRQQKSRRQKHFLFVHHFSLT